MYTELEEFLQPFWRSLRPALKPKLKPTLGSKSLLRCVGYTWTQARVCKSTLVCLHRCRLLSCFSDSQSWAQHPQVPSPPGLIPCSLQPRLTFSHLLPTAARHRPSERSHGHGGHSGRPRPPRRRKVSVGHTPMVAQGSLPRMAAGDWPVSVSLTPAPPPRFSRRK